MLKADILWTWTNIVDMQVRAHRDSMQYTFLNWSCLVQNCLFCNSHYTFIFEDQAQLPMKHPICKSYLRNTFKDLILISASQNDIMMNSCSYCVALITTTRETGNSDGRTLSKGFPWYKRLTTNTNRNYNPVEIGQKAYTNDTVPSTKSN